MVVTPEEAMDGARGSSSAERLENKIKHYETEIDEMLLKDFRHRKSISYEFPSVEEPILVEIMKKKYERFYDVKTTEAFGAAGACLTIGEKR